MPSGVQAVDVSIESHESHAAAVTQITVAFIVVLIVLIALLHTAPFVSGGRAWQGGMRILHM